MGDNGLLDQAWRDSMSHKDAPPESHEQAQMRLFYEQRKVPCGWGRDKDGNYFAPFARDAWAAWQEAQRTARELDAALAEQESDSHE